MKTFLEEQGHLIHPILFSIFPLISFFGANADEIRTSNAQPVALLVLNLVILSVIWLVSFIIFRNLKKASLLTAFLLFIFFAFGRFHNLFQGVSIKTPVTLIGPSKALIIICFILMTLVIHRIFKISTENIKKANYILSVVAIVMISSSLISFVLAWSSSSDAQRTTSSDGGKISKIKSNVSSQSNPDIYYILLDAYARDDFLKEKSEFDNSEFLNSLKQTGFYIADKANSNYAHTHLSVPSMLNMKYLNYLADQVGSESSNRSPLKELTHNNEVANIFKQKGYKYINIGSRWEWTLDSPQSDVTFKDKVSSDSKLLNIDLDESAVVYLQTTALKPWISTSIRSHFVAKTLGAFENTAEVANIPEPTLTFTHINSPHPPYLFDRDGPLPSQSTLELDNQGFAHRDMFVDQTVYMNKLTLDLVDKILAKSKNSIIIIASDHGPASGIKASEFDVTSNRKINIEGTKERMGILNAYYFPDKNYRNLYSSISPVNSFRLILGQYFNDNYELYLDRSYLSDNAKNQYLFKDVTDIVSIN